MIKLNLGCGNDILDGWENFDMYPINKKVKYINLHELPLPFDTDYADEIRLHRVLEHLVYRKEFMYEMSRILKSGGRISVVLPTFVPSLDHKISFCDRYTMVSVCDNIVKKKPVHGSPQPFHLIRFSYVWGSPVLFLKNIFMIIRCLYYGTCRFEMVNKK